MVDYYLKAELPKIQSVLVVTPTVNAPTFKDAAASVTDQKTDYKFEHLVVFDGVEPPRIRGIRPKHVKQMILPWNVGANGFYGHRVYAAIGHLVNHDAILFLDEDNWYSADHIQETVSLLEKEQLDFSFSARKIWQDDKEICIDRFESIGDEPHFLVDTSSYCFRREFLIRAGFQWHHGWGADRRFFSYARHINAIYKGTGFPSLNYRLDGNPNSPKREFFEAGNLAAGWNKKGTKKNA